MTHLLPDVEVGARVVVCTTNGNGGSRMSRRWDADEPAAEVETPLVGGIFEAGAPLPVDSVGSRWRTRGGVNSPF